MPFDYRIHQNYDRRVRQRAIRDQKQRAWRINHELSLIAQRRRHAPAFTYIGQGPDIPSVPKVSLTKSTKKPLLPPRRTKESELQRQKDFERTHNRKRSLEGLKREVRLDKLLTRAKVTRVQRFIKKRHATQWWKRPEALVEHWDHHTPPAKYWSAPTIPLRQSTPRPGKFPPKAYARHHAAAMDRLNKAHDAQQRWRFWYYVKHKKSI